MVERTRILTQSDQAEIWTALLERIEHLKEVLTEIDPIDDYAANYLKRTFTQSIPLLEQLAEDILCAVEVQIRLREEDDNPPWDP